MEFGEFLKINLKDLSLRQIEIKTGIGKSHLSRIINGSYAAPPKPDTLKKLSLATNCTYEELMIAAGYIEEKEALVAPVLGSIPAGIPLEAIEDIIDYEELDPDKFKSGKYYGLKVKGDSMAPEIKNNDVVILRVQDTCDTGDICAVIINGFEATLKRVKREDTGITLIPINNTYLPQFFTNEQIEKLPLRIIGKVVEVRRSY